MAKERRWPVDQLVLMVLDLEVVSLTLKLPEVWGNTSKAGMVLDDLEVASCVLDLEVVAKERRKERRWPVDQSLTSLTLDYELIKNVYKQSS